MISKQNVMTPKQNVMNSKQQIHDLHTCAAKLRPLETEASQVHRRWRPVLSLLRVPLQWRVRHRTRRSSPVTSAASPIRRFVALPCSRSATALCPQRSPTCPLKVLASCARRGRTIRAAGQRSPSYAPPHDPVWLSFGCECPICHIITVPVATKHEAHDIICSELSEFLGLPPNLPPILVCPPTPLSTATDTSATSTSGPQSVVLQAFTKYAPPVPKPTPTSSTATRCLCGSCPTSSSSAGPSSERAHERVAETPQLAESSQLD